MSIGIFKILKVYFKTGFVRAKKAGFDVNYFLPENNVLYIFYKIG